MSETSTDPAGPHVQLKPKRAIRAIRSLAIALMSSGVLFLLAGSYGTTQEPSTTLRVGTNLWIGYQPLRVAQNAGNLPGGIALLEGRSTSALMEALKIGTLDAATLTLDEAVRVANGGVPISVALVLDVSDGADVVIAKSNAVASAGPRGKRIGVETGAVGAFVLFRWLALNNMQVSDVTIVDVAPPNHARAFAEMNVDFLVTYEPLASKSFTSDSVVVFDSSKIAGDVVDVLVVRRDRIKTQFANIERLRDAWFAGTEEMSRRTPAALLHLSRHQDMTSDEIDAVLTKLRFPSAKENADIFRHGRLKLATKQIDAWLASEGIRANHERTLAFTDILAGTR